MTPAELRVRAEDCECLHCKEALRQAADEIERLRKRLELAEAVCESASKAMDSAVIKYAPYASYSEALLNLDNALKDWRQAREEGGE